MPMYGNYGCDKRWEVSYIPSGIVQLLARGFAPELQCKSQ
jgi:hypothetical protein